MRTTGHSPFRSCRPGVCLAALLLVPPHLPAAEHTLEWNDNSDNELGFRIERARSGEGFAELATVPTDVVRFTDRTADANTVYLYRVRAYNDAGSSEFSNVASNGPILTASFQSRMPTPAGSPATASVTVAGPDPTSLRWQRSRDGGLTWSDLSDDASFSGTSGSQLALAAVTAELDANWLRVAAESAAGMAYSNSIVLTLGIPARLANFSIRATAGSEADTLILGFAVEGRASKQLLVRGIGPTLASFGVESPLVDPQLAVYSGGQLLATNDDWEQAADAAQIVQAATRLGAFPLPASSRDAALLARVAGGAGTAQVTGKGGASGITLVELYDAEGANPAQVVNLSARTRVGVGDQTPIVGFSIAGEGPLRVLVRAVGPTLAGFGVSGVLQNPRLSVFREGQSLPLQENDDWGGSAQLKTLFTAAGAFDLPEASRDAAAAMELTAGTYTVQVSSSGGTTGAVLIELYALAK